MVSVLVHAAGLGVHGLLLKVAVEPIVGTPEAFRVIACAVPETSVRVIVKVAVLPCVVVVLPPLESA